MARVLLVDDDPDIRETTSWRLRLDGHEVIEVSDADAATAVGTGCQVVVVDLHQPGHDSDRACRELRAHPSTRELPLIYYTGAQLGTVISAREARLGTGQPVSRLLTAIERLSATVRRRTVRCSAEQ